MLNVSPAGPNVLAGKAFDPQRNATYTIPIEAGERRMTTQGCIFAGILCKSMSWTRLGPAPNPAGLFRPHRRAPSHME